MRYVKEVSGNGAILLIGGPAGELGGGSFTGTFE